MDISPVGIVAFVTDYIQSLPAEIARGDVFALTITFIAFFIAVVIINRLTGLLITVLKKIILFLIVTLAFWQFITLFYVRVTTEGMTTDTLIFGAAGFIAGFIAISISLYVALGSLYQAKKAPPRPAPEEEEPVPVPSGPVPMTAAEGTGTNPEGLAAVRQTPVPAESAVVKPAGLKESLSITSLKNDRSLGAVLAYLIIAQFGVFSSKTIPAPTFQVGLAFFALFVIAGLFFIHFTYNNYITGVRHLVLAILVGAAIAVILGYFWGGIPLDELLSPAFFQTDALVALVTGLALSLFMGGKG